MRKLSLTIGIPAYNEEKNISSLITSIMNQKQTVYHLKKIIVAVDGCKDGTNEIVTKISSKNSKVMQISSPVRMGKIFQLNKMYNLADTDIFLTLDADITLKNSQTIDNILKYFSDTKTSIVGANTLPLSPENLFERIVVTWLKIWQDIRMHYKNGNNIHNNIGCALALRKQLYKSISIPISILSDEDYIYIYSIEHGYKFSFARKATVYYRTVQNLNDFYKQHGRFLFLKKSVRAYFGDQVLSYYIIPRQLKINALIRSFIKDPIFTLAAIFLQTLLIIFLMIKPVNIKGKFWQIAYSSKSI